MRYGVVIEQANGNYSAYVPDLPGCVATGASVKDVERDIRDAIRFHIEGLKEDGLPVPAPTSIAEYVEASGSAEAWPVSLIIADPALVLPSAGKAAVPRRFM